MCQRRKIERGRETQKETVRDRHRERERQTQRERERERIVCERAFKSSCCGAACSFQDRHSLLKK